MARMSKQARKAIQERVAPRVEVALLPYTDDGDECNPHAVAVRDLLADVRHYCDAYKVDYANEDRVAYGHYRAERAGEI